MFGQVVWQTFGNPWKSLSEINLLYHRHQRRPILDNGTVLSPDGCILSRWHAVIFYFIDEWCQVSRLTLVRNDYIPWFCSLASNAIVDVRMMLWLVAQLQPYSGSTRSGSGTQCLEKHREASNKHDDWQCVDHTVRLWVPVDEILVCICAYVFSPSYLDTCVIHHTMSTNTFGLWCQVKTIDVWPCEISWKQWQVWSTGRAYWCFASFLAIRFCNVNSDDMCAKHDLNSKCPIISYV